MHDTLPFNLFIRMSRGDIKSFIQLTTGIDGSYFSFQAFKATTFTGCLDEGEESFLFPSLLPEDKPVVKTFNTLLAVITLHCIP